MKILSIKLKFIVMFSVICVVMLGTAFNILKIMDEAKNDADIVNALGRQRMLSQVMAKSILGYTIANTISQKQGENENILEEYNTAKTIFSQTLITMKSGGKYPLDLQMRKFKSISAIKNSTARDKILEIEKEFSRFQKTVLEFLGFEKGLDEYIQSQNVILSRSNQLRKLSDDLSKIYTEVANKNQRNIKKTLILSGTIILLILLIAFYIVRGILRQIGGEPADIAMIADQVAQGKTSLQSRFAREAPTGIYGALQNMVEALKSKVTLAENIAKGDLLADVPLASDADNLGIAMQKMTKTLREISSVAKGIADGDYSREVEVKGEKDILAQSMNRMSKTLGELTGENRRQNRLKTGQNKLNEKMRGDLDLLTLANNIIIFVSKYLGAQIGALYLAEKNRGELKLYASYAFSKRKSLNDTIKIGEGLAGQAAFEKEMISITDIPENYSRINSAIGDEKPRNIVVTPFLNEGKLVGVIEIGAFKEFSDTDMEFLKTIIDNISISINSAIARKRMTELLKETQLQTEKLQVQQEELSATNEELEQQTMSLKKSEEQLRVQQEELQTTNEELEEKTEFLEQQKNSILKKNDELEITRQDIEKKAKELSIASKYKSEFLANMSHELRTPLNSLLLLSRTLSNNKEKNLTENQIESANIIYNSGNDLLSLINEILDLSKIEAGQMNVELEMILISELSESIKLNFQHLVSDRSLTLDISIDKNLPLSILTDSKRLKQIIKNLMSNAVKFTKNGGIKVKFTVPATEEISLAKSGLNIDKSIAIAVIDTGIGISEEKQKVIFEAFQQGDIGTAKKFGGTGLGLSISRELAKLLGGEIQLKSDPGNGSTFTILLPFKLRVEHKPQAITLHTEPLIHPPQIVTIPSESYHSKTGATQFVTPFLPDDRDNLKKGDQAILVIEDDPNFAKILLNQCKDKGFKCLVSGSAEEGLELARTYLPSAIILDIKLPGMDGMTALEILKDNIKTRHIPVHIMSVKEDMIEALKRGAIGYLTKPVSEEQLEEAFGKFEKIIGKGLKDLLVVEDDKILRKSIVELVGNGDVKVSEAASGKEVLKILKSKRYDCMILDLGLPDITGFELLKKLEKEQDIVIPPVVIYTGKDLTRKEEAKLSRYSESIIVKTVNSDERLLDETALFLHRVVDNMPQKKRKIIRDLYDGDTIFKDKKALLVDDDMRNAFALSGILQEKGVGVIKAENGSKALEILKKEPNINIVLMDIMMPGMDGYETIKKIREMDKFVKLPIIALTAKAMKEDRQKCIAAGASDYLTKPVNVERLFSMMRVWLYR